jgi:hypothetical protein
LADRWVAVRRAVNPSDVAIDQISARRPLADGFGESKVLAHGELPREVDHLGGSAPLGAASSRVCNAADVKP